MTKPQETLQIDDLNLFAHMLSEWHKKKVATLKHMAEVPEGTEVTIGDAYDPVITLTGATLDGFKLGIELSLMELGELPFITDTEDEEVAESETVAA